MEKNINKNIDYSKDTYNLPVRLYPKYMASIKIFIIFLTLSALALSYLLITNKIHNSDTESLVDFIMIIAFFLLLGMDLIHGEVLHKQYIELNNEGIKVKSLLFSRFIKWSDILSIGIVKHFRTTEYIAITKAESEGILKKIRKYLAYGEYISVRLEKYSEIEPHMFINTVEKKMSKDNYIQLKKY
ncbi:hypothetical protein P8V03_03625 [Clostridium sp. A1-XYC3]|uniref:DUF304 domain-containing protein n=1 Tax=Clostridium tanneri TaxID=3037988 RepID=A0ABU4JQ12_9CLOT|nr:hypothetical protein [Clostridium sp. A1-XYC3]MDW8800240.1 hypothetical protein [Clostridium sp. A1-XYC3]